MPHYDKSLTLTWNYHRSKSVCKFRLRASVVRDWSAWYTATERQ